MLFLWLVICFGGTGCVGMYPVIGMMSLGLRGWQG